MTCNCKNDKVDSPTVFDIKNIKWADFISVLGQATYNLEEAAAYLKCDTKAVKYYAKRKRTLAYVPVGKSMTFLKSDLDAFLLKNRIKENF